MSRPFASPRFRGARAFASGPAIVRPSERWFCLRAIADGLPDAVLSDDELCPIILHAAQLPVDETSNPAQIRAGATQALTDGTAERLTKSDVVYANLSYLQGLLGLSDLDCDLLAIAVAVAGRGGVYTCLGWLFGASGTCPPLETYTLLAAMAGVAPEAIAAALADNAPLATSQLLQFEFSNGADRCLNLLEACERALQRPGLDAAGLLAQLIAVAPPAELDLGDYAHLAEDASNLKQLLAHALEQGTRGLNVLIHGAPGTGKTQLARALAKALGVPLYEPHFPDERLPDRGGRVRNLSLCQALLHRQPRALVLFDEAEDAFPQELVIGLPFASRPRQRAWQHQALESNSTPVLWIANSVKHLDPAVVRRFAVVVEVREPPQAARLQMLRRALGGLHVTASWLERTAEDPSLTPADMVRAARVATALAEPSLPVDAALDWAMRGHRALRQRRDASAYRLDRQAYDLSFVNADKDLSLLVRQLTQRPRATLCLAGPPGTGKTAFCAHLAQALGVPLIQAKSSDLLDKYVGESEKRIADLFRAAKAQGAVLLLDEADGLLRDRRHATHSWELTQVNELLCQMEAFDGIFACATNLPGELDQATLRRFHLKVAFGAIRKEQTKAAFLKIYEAMGGDVSTVPPQALAQVEQLRDVCLGDLHAARRHCEILSSQPTALEFADAIAEEVAARATPRVAAGFLANDSRHVLPCQ